LAPPLGGIAPDGCDAAGVASNLATFLLPAGLTPPLVEAVCTVADGGGVAVLFLLAANISSCEMFVGALMSRPRGGALGTLAAGVNTARRPAASYFAKSGGGAFPVLGGGACGAPLTTQLPVAIGAGGAAGFALGGSLPGGGALSGGAFTWASSANFANATGGGVGGGRGPPVVAVDGGMPASSSATRDVCGNCIASPE
jgi:hypothetical protein